MVRNALSAVDTFPTGIAETFVFIFAGAISVLHIAPGAANGTIAKSAHPTFVTKAFKRILATPTILATRQSDALVAQFAPPSLLTDALSWLFAIPVIASVLADGNIASGTLPLIVTITNALEGFVLARAMKATRHFDAAVASHALPTHFASTRVGPHAVPMIASARISAVSRLEGANRIAAHIFRIGPAIKTDHFVVFRANVMVGVFDIFRDTWHSLMKQGRVIRASKGNGRR